MMHHENTKSVFAKVQEGVHRVRTAESENGGNIFS